MTGRGTRIVALVLCLLALGASVAVVLKAPTDGTPVDARALELNTGTPIPGAQRSGTVERGKDGFVISGESAGTASVPARFPGLQPSESAVIRIWAYGDGSLDTVISVRRSDGSQRRLGRAREWAGKEFDVTSDVRQGPLRLVAGAQNGGADPRLFLDRLVSTRVPEDAQTDAAPWLIGLWVALLLAAALQFGGRLRRHWFLPAVAAFGAALLWHQARDQGFAPLGPDANQLWATATDAEWLDLHHGLVSGSFGPLSSLAVQLHHALTPIVGVGTFAARGATVLIAVVVIAAFYATGTRVAGRLGGATAASLALLADPFREAAISGTAVMATLFAAVLFVYALHVCLATTTRAEMVLLAGAGAVCVLADVTWLPGVIAALAIVALRYAPSGERARIFGVGLLALTLLLLPNRLSTADQNDGDVLADLRDRATFARNVEFAGEGHGAPQPAGVARDPYGGEKVGLLEYMFGDHSVSVVVGGTLTGFGDAIDAFAEHRETRIAGLLGFFFTSLGALYLLIVPRLRSLLLVPLLLAIPGLFFVSRGAAEPFAAAVPLWAGFIVSGGVLAYVVRRVSEGRRSEREPGVGATLRKLPGRIGRRARSEEKVAAGDTRL